MVPNRFISLPKPQHQGSMSLEAAISERRSMRSFSGQLLTEAELSQLLWAGQGITAPKKKLRAAPSAGATYPLETYVITSQGFYHYWPEQHALEEKKTGDFRMALAQACLNQNWMQKAAAIVVLTSLATRTTYSYGQERGWQYIYLEAGHTAQNLHLQAVALHLASTPIGAFDDRNVARLLDLPKTEKPIYIIPIGRHGPKGPRFES